MGSFWEVALNTFDCDAKMMALLSVKVIPKSSRTEIVGWEGDHLKIRVKGVPEKGEVNRALIAYLAELLGIAKSRIELVSGETSRLKRVRIEGLSQEEVENRCLPPN